MSGEGWPSGPLTLEEVEAECESRGHHDRGDGCACARARIAPESPHPEAGAWFRDPSLVADPLPGREPAPGPGFASPPGSAELSREVLEPLVEAWDAYRDLADAVGRVGDGDRARSELEALRRARLCLAAPRAKAPLALRLGPDPVTSKSVEVAIDEEVRSVRARAEVARRRRDPEDVFRFAREEEDALQRLRVAVLGSRLP